MSFWSFFCSANDNSVGCDSSAERRLLLGKEANPPSPVHGSLNGNACRSCRFVALDAYSDVEGARVSRFINASESGAGNWTEAEFEFKVAQSWHSPTTAMADLPSMIPTGGRVFVITHSSTFSAGISSIGFVTQPAPQQLTMLGETIGEGLVFYGETRDLVLPKSGIGVSYATALHDYLHGCRRLGRCFWVDWIFSIEFPTLAPDIVAPLSFTLLAARREPATETIRLAITSGLHRY